MTKNRRPLKSMMSTLDLWKKICIIAACAALIRLGSVVPLPFVNASYMEAVLGDGLGFLNAITGGSFYQMSFFALSISPYITASIIVELLTVAIPSLDELKKDGKTGQDKIKRITFILAAVMALVESVGMAAGLGSQGLLTPYNAGTVIAATVIWTLGALALIGIGEFLSLMDIGGGISMILVINILASLPSDITTIFYVITGTATNAAFATVEGVLAVCVFVLVCAACVLLCKTCKKVRISAANRLSGKADSYFPIPLNTCSVLPVIFASSLMSMPVLISRFVPAMQTGVAGHIVNAMSSSYWFLPSAPAYTLGAVLYAVLTTFFTVFYLDIAFNPYEIADNFKKSGITIPGIRPGTPTVEYIRKESLRIALLGNALMTALILLMDLVLNASGLGSLSIAGTSIIICVSVILDEKERLAAASKVKYATASYGFLGSKERKAKNLAM